MKAELINVVRQLKALDNAANVYLDSVPREFTGIMVDNPYAESQWNMIKVLCTEMFGDMYDDIDWFLTAWDAERNNKFWLADDTEIVINTAEDYYEYLKGQ